MVGTLVVCKSKPYHSFFTATTIEAARPRMEDTGACRRPKPKNSSVAGARGRTSGTLGLFPPKPRPG
jgi:hypothetical protein